MLTPGAPPKLHLPLPEEGETLGEYVLGGLLGQGGMGAVYSAWDPRLDRQVAVKVLLRFGDGRDAERGRAFLGEARHVARLNHPHIVVVHDTGETRGHHWYVMELSPRGSMARRLRSGPFPVEVCLSWLEGLAAALAHIHAAGLLHQDLKPANFLCFGTPPEADTIKIADFGLATLARGADYGGHLTGTGPYMAPELWTGTPPSIRSDLYSLGICVFEMLAGLRPFHAVSWPNFWAQDPPVAPPSLDRFREDVPPALNTLVMRLIARHPHDRPADAPALLAALRALREDTSPAVVPTAENNPYRGLRAFDTHDHALFFGRRREVDTLEARLLHLAEAPGGRRFVTVIGASGLGKSSLVRAGLVSRLRAQTEALTQPVSDADGAWSAAHPGWEVVTVVPGAAPLAALIHGLRPLAGPHSDGAEALAAAEARLPHPGWRLLVVVDPLEEIFTSCPDEAERRRFVELLLEATARPGGRTSVVATLRSDLLDATSAAPDLSRQISDQGLVLAVLDRGALREIIDAPARIVGHPLDAGVVERLLAEAEGQPGALPLLQHTLSALWLAMAAGEDAADALDRLGGVGGALSHTADHALASLPPGRQVLARRIFHALLNQSADGAVLRRRREVASLQQEGERGEEVEEVLAAFSAADTRILVIGRQGEGPRTVEVAHEMLFSRWDTLRGWIQAWRADLPLLEAAEAAGRAWQEGPSSAGDLWRGPRLSLLLEIVDRRGAELTGEVLRFAAASRRQARRERSLRLGALGVLVALLLTLAGLWVIAVEANRRAEVTALRSGAEASLGRDPILALHLAYRAWKQAPGPDTVSNVYHVWARVRERASAVGTTAALAAGWSPDGARLAWATFSGQRVLWERSTGRWTPLAPCEGEPRLLTWVGAPAQLVGVCQEGRVEWRASEGGAPWRTLEVPGPVIGAQVDADEGEVLVLGRGGLLSRWDFKGQRLVDREVDLGGLQLSAALPRAFLHPLPHGGPLVITTSRGPALLVDRRTWQVRVLAEADGGDDRVGWFAGGDAFYVLGQDGVLRGWTRDGDVAPGHITGIPGGMAFASTHPRLAVSSAEGVALLDAAFGLEGELSHPAARVRGLAFSPDDQRLAVGDAGGLGAVWQLKPRRRLMDLTGHTGAVTTLLFSPDGAQVTTLAQDGHLKVFDLFPSLGDAPPITRDSGLHGVEVTPDGAHVVVGTADGGLLLTSPGGVLEAELCPLEPAASVGLAPTGVRPPGDCGASALRRLVISPDGRYVGVREARGDERIAIVDLRERRSVVLPTRSVWAFTWLRTTPPTFVTADPRGRITRWSASGITLDEAEAHTHHVSWIEGAPSGDGLLTSSHDGTVALWDNHLHLRRRLEGHNKAAGGAPLRLPLTNAAWSPDGSRLAAAGADRWLRIWDRAGGLVGEVEVPLTEFLGRVAWSPDGRRVAVVLGTLHGEAQEAALLFDAQARRIGGLGGHTAPLNDVVWSTTGQLATVGGDAKVRLWTAEGQALATLDGGLGAVHHAAFVPDGSRLVTTHQGGVALFWPLEAAALEAAVLGRLHRPLTSQEQAQYLPAPWWGLFESAR